MQGRLSSSSRSNRDCRPPSFPFAKLRSAPWSSNSSIFARCYRVAMPDAALCSANGSFDWDRRRVSTGTRSIAFVPVGLPKEHRGQAFVVSLPLSTKILRAALLKFPVCDTESPRRSDPHPVRVTVALTPGGELPRQLRKARSPFRLRLVVHLPKPGIRARSSVEQRCRRAHETVRSSTIETEVLREAQVGQGIPSARDRPSCRIPWIEQEEPAHSVVIPMSAAVWMSLAAISGWAVRIASARSRGPAKHRLRGKPHADPPARSSSYSCKAAFST